MIYSSNKRVIVKYYQNNNYERQKRYSNIKFNRQSGPCNNVGC